MGDIVALADMVERLGVEQVLRMLTEEVKEFDEAGGIDQGWAEEDKAWIERVRRVTSGGVAVVRTLSRSRLTPIQKALPNRLLQVLVFLHPRQGS